MNDPGTVTKDPDATLDYALDWTAWLPEGDTIDSITLTAAGVDIVSSSHDATTVTVWLGGGTPGKATLTCRVHTTQGRVDDRTLTLYIRNR